MEFLMSACKDPQYSFFKAVVLVF